MGAKDNLSLYGEYNKIYCERGLLASALVFQRCSSLIRPPKISFLRLATRSASSGFFWRERRLQVFIAFLNKVVSWCAYHKHDKGKVKVNKAVLFFAAMENLFIIDIVLDITSLVTFGWSIILIMGLFVI